jgi:hypothetical protein
MALRRYVSYVDQIRFDLLMLSLFNVAVWPGKGSGKVKFRRPQNGQDIEKIKSILVVYRVLIA